MDTHERRNDRTNVKGTTRCKYIFNHGSTHELYDLETDPGEFANGIDDPGFKRTQSRLKDRLFAWYNPEHNPYRAV